MKTTEAVIKIHYIKPKKNAVQNYILPVLCGIGGVAYIYILLVISAGL